LIVALRWVRSSTLPFTEGDRPFTHIRLFYVALRLRCYDVTTALIVTLRWCSFYLQILCRLPAAFVTRYALRSLFLTVHLRCTLFDYRSFVPLIYDSFIPIRVYVLRLHRCPFRFYPPHVVAAIGCTPLPAAFTRSYTTVLRSVAWIVLIYHRGALQIRLQRCCLLRLPLCVVRSARILLSFVLLLRLPLYTVATLPLHDRFALYGALL